MPIINRIAEFHDDMQQWRRDIHAHPETAFEEERTAAIVAEMLVSFGIETHTGIATTGVVGVLHGGNGTAGGRAIGLRADLDALDIHENNDFDHVSVNPGKMHACGHDGHTTMLLGAARYLAETRRFDGTIYFIFQPAEENEGGGRVMVEEGLFERFPMEAVYGLHNWPGAPAGKFAVRPGPMMAAFDILRNTDTGQAFGTDERRGNRAVLEARKDGVIIRPLGDTMVLMPPLNIPPELLGRIVETTATAVARATSD